MDWVKVQCALFIWLRIDALHSQTQLGRLLLLLWALCLDLQTASGQHQLNIDERIAGPVEQLFGRGKASVLLQGLWIRNVNTGQGLPRVTGFLDPHGIVQRQVTLLFEQVGDLCNGLVGWVGAGRGPGNAVALEAGGRLQPDQVAIGEAVVPELFLREVDSKSTLERVAGGTWRVALQRPESKGHAHRGCLC